MSEIKILPVLPLRDIVVFPHMLVPLFVGRDKSVRALEEVMKTTTSRSCSPPRRTRTTTIPRPTASTTSASIATVLQLLKLPDGTVKVLVEGRARAARRPVHRPGRVLRGRDRRRDRGRRRAARGRGAVARGGRAVRELCEAEQEGPARGPGLDPADRPIPASSPTSIASHLSVKIADKQQLLEIFNVVKRLEKVYALMEGEISVLQVEKKIRNRVKRQMEKTQREYYLNEQMKAIQRELGEQDDQRDELLELEKRIKKTKLSKEARTKAEARAQEAAQHEPDVGGIHRRAQLPRLAAVDPVGQGQAQADRPAEAERDPRGATTTAWRRSRSASWSTWRCRAAPAR